MTETIKLTKHNLNYFIGDTVRYRHPINRKVIYSPGVKFVADHAGAYWLIDIIASWLGSHDYLHATAYDERLCYTVFWTLEVQQDHTAKLIGKADSGEKPAYTQEIPFTDFPLSKIDIWSAFSDGCWTLYLPSEH